MIPSKTIARISLLQLPEHKNPIAMPQAGAIHPLLPLQPARLSVNERFGVCVLLGFNGGAPQPLPERSGMAQVSSSQASWLETPGLCRSRLGDLSRKKPYSTKLRPLQPTSHIPPRACSRPRLGSRTMAGKLGTGRGSQLCLALVSLWAQA